VRHACVDGLRVILDLRTERYRVLDDTASLLWAVLTGDEAALAASEHYDLLDEDFRAELERFARRCLDEGLLQPADEAAAPDAVEAVDRRARTIGSRTLRALSALISTQHALRRSGFRETYERYAQLPVGTEASVLDSVLQAFVRAENFFVGRRAPDDCLARSLSLYRFLRSVGVPAEHVIGVRRLPFAAHAWVECDGVPVLAAGQAGLTPLARIGDPHAANGEMR
jgi:hypothetical protein